jgi:hypothetical protein
MDIYEQFIAHLLELEKHLLLEPDSDIKNIIFYLFMTEAREIEFDRLL